jgi:RNA polymerase sigma-70 factor (sigma-E family)
MSLTSTEGDASVEGFTGGHEERVVFDAFVASRGNALLRFCMALCASRADAEDLLQESLARCFVRWRRIARADHPEAYVRRVIVTQHANTFRRRRFRLTPLSESVEDGLPAEAAGADSDLRQTLRAAIAALPVHQRIVMVLSYLEDLPDPEIAAALNCSVNTVKSHRARGLKHLRSNLPLVAALRD